MSDVFSLSWPQALLFWSFLPLVLAGALGALRYRRLSPEMRALAGLAWWLLPIELLARMLMLRHLPNLFLKPIADLGELALVALVYQHALRRLPFAKAIPWLVGVFAAYVLADSVLLAEVARFKPAQTVLEAGLVGLFVSQYFRQLLRELTVQRLDLERFHKLCTW